jgi:hypothetical protein
MPEISLYIRLKLASQISSLYFTMVAPFET